MYYIWLDESDKEGTFYSNFYGGILIESKHLENVVKEMQSAIDSVGLQNEEIKWQKVNVYTLERYKVLVDLLFQLMAQGKVKMRIFFHHRQFVPVGLTPEKKRKEYSMLYYQFVKYGFGLQYANDTDKEVRIRLLLDEMPLKGDDRKEFLMCLYQLNNDTEFKKAKIRIAEGDIAEVNSKKHLPLQFMDLVLGAVSFWLNEKYKEKDPVTGKRGKRTICKEKMYKYINRHIRTLYPGFNVGISTPIVNPEDRWKHPYRHWSFIPRNSERDPSLTKKQKNIP